MCEKLKKKYKVDGKVYLYDDFVDMVAKMYLEDDALFLTPSEKLEFGDKSAKDFSILLFKILKTFP